jgi:hypothetical protein
LNVLEGDEVRFGGVAAEDVLLLRPLGLVDAGGFHEDLAKGSLVWRFAQYLWDEAQVPLAETIETYVDVVIRLFKIAHGVFLYKPFVFSAWVRRMKQVPRTRAFKDPVSKSVILALVTRERVSLATRTAAMLAYFLCERLGVMVQAKVGEFSPAFALRRRDVRFLPLVGCYEIMFRKGKTNTYNVAESRFLIPAAPGALFCPVRFLTEFLAASVAFDGDQDLPLLRHEDGRNVTRHHVVSLLKLVGGEMGLDPATLGGHTFRISAATQAAADNVPLEVIQMFGHWATLTGMLRYLRWTGRLAVRVVDALELGKSLADERLALLDPHVRGAGVGSIDQSRTRGLLA